MIGNNMSGLARVLKETIKHYKLQCFIVLILILVSAVAGVYGSVFLQSLIDDYITPLTMTNDPDFGPLIMALIRLATIYCIGILSTYTWSRLMITISLGTLNDTRESLFNHMESLPIAYFDTHAHGDIMSVYTNDTDTLRQLISQSFPQMISSLATMLFVLVSMLMLNPPLTLIALLMACVMIFVSRFITKRSGRYFRQQQMTLGEVNGFIEEMMEGSKVIKVFTHEEQSIQDFEKVNEKLCEASTQANKFANILMPIVMNIGYISYVLTAFIGAWFALHDMFGMTVGTIASFLLLNRQFTNPIGQISQQINAVIMAGAGASRIYAILDEPSETDHGIVTLVNVKKENGEWVECSENTGHWCWRHPRPNGKVQLVELKGDVRFHDVTFGYTKKKVILHDISLFAKPGQKIAFVGATGAGKTTITNLINRFYEIQKGSITYDGIDIKLIKKPDLRRSLGIVLQDTNLFSGTIMDNIRFGKLDATDEECIAAAKLANADEFVRHLEHGYNTYISGTGESLSQGQRQLLAIARAAVANPPVLILDEATSSIDTRTERIVQEGMDKLMAGRTVFVIAHRLSTIQNSDAIMVLEQGRIIERGDHDDLIKEKGTYYQLYTGAFELD
ncbi:ABC transporter ATP-binding protein [uncultured Dubosiella sp.]|jgi:ATP-binding cassette subfamily B protein|uniref:ABC transporter ATP-binding protein n=2 Tax=uncultured Dubosiella sp. TaxID=1937011 RepID=UPI0020860167|nr:ABC transporter ATP-binding protein [uncultured Dubosiella sp.]GJM58407.1 ABC transporter [Erysipelotrichaceae bacterium OPF54]